jgi:hypothetical protein
MKGSPVAAETCFNQFYSSTQKMRSKIPTNGHVVHTVAKNLDELINWLDSEQGKDYIKKKQK